MIKMSDETSCDACVVCFKNVEIFSIGICDHPVCYECSTRMRVLCGQKECPICRQELSVVIFTKNIRPFKEINYNDFNMDDSTGISFENAAVMNAFYNLQKIKCPKCPSLNQPYFQTFKSLETHVKDEHSLMYCELCVTYLKLFPFERRPYTKSELSQHNKLGDKNDMSHRGHSLCKFCNKRFFDNDFLYRHLRREHFSCHFCENEGHNKFYSSYEYLRHHFLKKHFLCEEGDCRGEQFVNAFRNEIDLKAHKLEKHSKSLSKQAYKEARILPLDIQRSISNGRNQLVPHSSRFELGSNTSSVPSRTPQEREPAVVINIAEFPTLSGSSSTAAPPVVPRRVPDRMCGRSNFKMTHENFPALGAESSSRPSTTNSIPDRSKSSTAASSVNKVPANNSLNSSIRNSNTDSKPVPQWGTSRKKENVQPLPEKPKQPKKERVDEFPSLSPALNSAGSSKSKKPKQGSNEYDMPQTSSNNQINKIKVKKKQSAENNEEKSKAENAKKKQKTSEAKQNNEMNKSTKTCKEHQLSKNSNYSVNDSSSSSKNSVNNVKTNTSDSNQDKSKKANSSGKKDKIMINESDFPSLSSNHSNNSNNNQNSSISKKSSTNSKSKKDKEKNILKERDFPSLNNIQTSNNQPSVKPEQKSANHVMESKKKKSVPPGFESQVRTTVPNPPPGFTPINHNVENNFLNQNFSYQNPPNSRERHDALRQACKNIFRNKDNLYDTFLQESHLFKDNILNAESYLKSVSNMMAADQFHSLFPELVFLLPNIQKQKELFAAYIKFHKKNASKLEKYDCAFCQQILKVSDQETHLAAHMLNLDFPSLGGSKKQPFSRK